MSALGIVFDRSKKAVDSQRFQTFLSALSHHGRNGCFHRIEGNFAFGIQHFSSLPLNHEQPNPTVDNLHKTMYSFCGRIDNREYLLSSIGGQLHSDLPDGTIAWRCYLKWGSQCFDRIIGAFVFAIANLEANTIIIARDALGDQPIYFHLNQQHFVAASEPAAIFAYSDFSREYDPVKVAAYVSGDWSSITNTYFKGIQELMPGHYAVVGRRSFQRIQYWQFKPDCSLAKQSADAVHQQFREILGQATRAQMRSADPVAISLSGGLDSTSIAVAARSRSSLRAFSWEFDQFSAGDERNAIASVVNQLELEHQIMSSDHLFTQFDQQGFPAGININGPFTNTVHSLKQTLYRSAAKFGCSVILVGDAADELYLGRNYWLRDLIHHGRIGTAVQHLPGALKRWVTGTHDGWLVFRLLLGEKIGLRRYFPQTSPRWMSEYTANQKPNPLLSPLVPDYLAAQPGYEFPLGHYRTEYMTYELGAIAESGIERRCPYRDRRVVEFMLSLPAWYYTVPPREKVLVRDAYANILPGLVINQKKSGALSGLFATGLSQSKKTVLECIRANSDWGKFYQSTLVIDAINRFSGLNQNRQIPDGILWNAICLNGWMQSINENNSLPSAITDREGLL